MSGRTMSVSEETKNIADIRPIHAHFNLHCIVVQVAPNSHKTKDGKEVRTCKIADKTGSINLSVWGEYCNVISPGDILYLFRCYATIFKNNLTVYIRKQGYIRKAGEFCMLFNELPDMSEPNKEWVQQFYENKAKEASLQQNKLPGSYKVAASRVKRDKDV